MMLTRCPGCTTTFRVTPEQVKVRHGKVRCGRCQHVFDAIEHLVETAPLASSTNAPMLVEAPVVEVPVVEVPVVKAPMPPSPAATAPVMPSAPQLVTPVPVPHPAPIAEETDLHDEPPTEPGEALPPEENTSSLLHPSPLSSAYTTQIKPTGPRWPWLLASLLALLALLAQLMIAYRVDLAQRQPALRPLLDTLCAQFHCSVELPSNPDLVSIEVSDLHPGHNNGLELTATLRNRAANAQQWPMLELTLTDGADKPIVRKVIAPAQYLPAEANTADGFAANGEQAVQLQLDAGTLPAAGYRLYLFYP